MLYCLNELLTTRSESASQPVLVIQSSFITRNINMCILRIQSSKTDLYKYKRHKYRYKRMTD